jgi:hypothetical protein
MLVRPPSCASSFAELANVVLSCGRPARVPPRHRRTTRHRARQRSPDGGGWTGRTKIGEWARRAAGASERARRPLDLLLLLGGGKRSERAREACTSLGVRMDDERRAVGRRTRTGSGQWCASFDLSRRPASCRRSSGPAPQTNLTSAGVERRERHGQQTTDEHVQPTQEA